MKMKKSTQYTQNMCKNWIAGIVLAGAAFAVSAQDVHFSQMSLSPLTLNPALAGANFGLEGNLNYRTQWASVAEPFKTTAASFNMRLNENKRSKKGHLAAGINFFNDKAGEAIMATNNVNLNLAYHIILNDKSTLGGGMYVGYGQRSLQPSSGKWASQYNGMSYDAAINPGETFLSDRLSFVDVGAGLLYTFKKDERYMTSNDQFWLNIGAAVYHIGQPSYSFINAPDERLYMRYSAFVNSIIGMGNSRLSLMPAVYYQRQGTAQEILMGTYFRYMIQEESKFTGYHKSSSFAAGVFYRNKDAVIVKGLFEWSGYALGLAYDFNVSSLTEVSRSRGGVEICLRMIMSDVLSASKSRI